jgi:hypothetical protein
MSAPGSDPPSADSLRLAIDRRECWYCRLDGQETRATHVVHDRRGCVPCCAMHGERRRRTSMLLGHRGCPNGIADGASHGFFFRHVTTFARP